MRTLSALVLAGDSQVRRRRAFDASCHQILYKKRNIFWGSRNHVSRPRILLYRTIASHALRRRVRFIAVPAD
jgi:hypothetical protein